jgi:hypothetical protein
MLGKLLTFMLLLVSVAAAQVPQPALPQTYIDTTYQLPAGGKTWAAHTATDLKSALAGALPGDVIVLDAGVVYAGNFTIKAKANPSDNWLYIISSPYLLPTAPPPGTRVNPATDANNMAKIVTPNRTSALTIVPGANYVRLVGIEMYSTSTFGANPTHTPWPINGSSFNLIGAQTASHITVDRCYLHGSDTQDLSEAFVAYEGASYIAVVDSVISDVHIGVQDSQAFISYGSQGPYKLVNNLLSAATEDVMFGGAGAGLPAPYNGYVPSDIEIRNNHFYKPLSWIPKTTGTSPQWVVKNNLECKSCSRLLADGNTFENIWNAAQGGAAIVLTVRTGQSGDNAVVDDITISNNVLKNVVSGFATLSHDYTCGTSQYPNCKNLGESLRVKIYNNLILFGNVANLNGGRNFGLETAVELTDWVFQHNTLVPAAGTTPWASVYFNGRTGVQTPWQSTTHNVWILDNVFTRQPTGDSARPISEYMGDPDPLATRFYGNVMYAPKGETVKTWWPVHNYATTVAVTLDNTDQLVTPQWSDTTDGVVAGYHPAQ